MASCDIVKSGPIAGIWATTDTGECVGLVAEDGVGAYLIALSDTTPPFAIIASHHDNAVMLQIPMPAEAHQANIGIQGITGVQRVTLAGPTGSQVVVAGETGTQMMVVGHTGAQETTIAGHTGALGYSGEPRVFNVQALLAGIAAPVKSAFKLSNPVDLATIATPAPKLPNPVDPITLTLPVVKTPI